MSLKETSQKSKVGLLVIGIPFICLFAISTISAQSTEQLIKGKKYTFSVQTVQPFRGQLRPEAQTSGYYTLRVTPDSLISYLPFFGRSYSASIGSTETGLEFTSVKFDYLVTDRKKGGWDISIKPRDVSKIQQLTLSIFPDGNASLIVISTSRDPMSFQGLVKAGK